MGSKIISSQMSSSNFPWFRICWMNAMSSCYDFLKIDKFSKKIKFENTNVWRYKSTTTAIRTNQIDMPWGLIFFRGNTSFLKITLYNGEKMFSSPKLDIFEYRFLINLMLFGSQRRLKWCIEVIVLFNRSRIFSDFSWWNRKSKSHFLDDMVGRIEFW